VPAQFLRAVPRAETQAAGLTAWGFGAWAWAWAWGFGGLGHEATNRSGRPLPLLHRSRPDFEGPFTGNPPRTHPDRNVQKRGSPRGWGWAVQGCAGLCGAVRACAGQGRAGPEIWPFSGRANAAFGMWAWHRTGSMIQWGSRRSGCACMGRRVSLALLVLFSGCCSGEIALLTDGGRAPRLETSPAM
jgi:hypothetical protein